jgi:hypothetical protein
LGDWRAVKPILWKMDPLVVEAIGLRLPLVLEINAIGVDTHVARIANASATFYLNTLDLEPKRTTRDLDHAVHRCWGLCTCDRDSLAELPHPSGVLRKSKWGGKDNAKSNLRLNATINDMTKPPQRVVQ